MDKTKSNGQVGHAVPAVLALPPAPSPPGGPFDQVKAIMEKEGLRKYAEGYRAAAKVLAPMIGQLDADGKKKLAKALDQLEDDLWKAEQAAL
jgi:hypothetical protein